MIIKKAILHILDFNSGVCVYSQQLLDFSDSFVSTYLEKHLQKEIIGQDAAIKATAKAIRRGRSGIADIHRPIGSADR